MRIILSTIILFISTTIVYGIEPNSNLGNLQVGKAGNTCSFWTTLFLGSKTAMGRNEGYLKSDDEINGLFGPFAIRQKMIFSDNTASGMGKDEYRFKILRTPMNMNLYKDVFQTVELCREREIVPENDINNAIQNLFHSNFINTDALIYMYKSEEISHEDIQQQLWDWLGYTYSDYKMNYYLLDGNNNMLRKLYECNLITKKQAKYMLGKWFQKFERLNVSLILDMEYFEIIDKSDADILMLREASMNPKFKNILPFDPKDEVAYQDIKEKVFSENVKPESIPWEENIV